MKKLFLYLLRKYTKTEKERLEVYRVLHERVRNEYYEQTLPGNVYNAGIEFVLSCDFISHICKNNNELAMNSIKIIINDSVLEGLKILKESHDIRNKNKS